MAEHSYDTVNIHIDAQVTPAVMHGLDGFAETYGDDALLRATGWLRNLRVTVTESGTRVAGSIAVFTYGTNAVPFDFDDVGVTLDEVAHALGLPLGDVLSARVSRLDIGLNIPLDRPVREVVSSLVALPRTQLQTYGPGSAVIKTMTRELAFYDKGAESSKRKLDVSPSYGDGPLLRVELRYTRQVSRQFSQPVTVGLLADRAFYDEAGNRLASAVEAVPFRPVLRITCPTTVPALRESLAALGTEAAGGAGAVISAIGTAHDVGLLSASQASRQRSWLRGLGTDPALAVESALTAALKAAVRQATLPG